VSNRPNAALPPGLRRALPWVAPLLGAALWGCEGASAPPGAHDVEPGPTHAVPLLPFDHDLPEEFLEARSLIREMVAERPVAPGVCAPAYPGCVAVAAGADEADRYVARLLTGPLQAVLPVELPFPGHPYLAWAPVEAVEDGVAAVSRWEALAADPTPLACGEGEEAGLCHRVVHSPFPDDPAPEASLWLCGTAVVEGVSSPPVAPCQPLVRRDGAGEVWVRALVGWGDAEMAAALGFVAESADPGAVTVELGVAHGPDLTPEEFIRLLDGALRDDPLALVTTFRPLRAPRQVDAVRRFEPSRILPPFREWVLVVGDAFGMEHPEDPEARWTELHLRTTLFVSRTATGDLRDYRHAQGELLDRYVAALRARVEAALALRCGQAPVGGVVECR